MAIVLSYHPFTRAAATVWMLEEVGCEYDLAVVDLRAGEQKEPALKALNPMGKLPTLVDGETVVTESAAIGLYLADRYAPSRLAPAMDDPRRGSYLRWSFYAPSVIEPGCLARAQKWDFSASQAGWGTYEEMLDTIESAIGDGPFLLGDWFTMADVVFGGTVRFMLRFGMLDPRPSFTAYVERLNQRAASQRADSIHARYVQELGLSG